MSQTIVHRVTVSRQQGFAYAARFDAVPAADPWLLDEPQPLGGGVGPNPIDLLTAAVGHCLAASLSMCLQKSRASIESLSATVTARVDRNERGRLRVLGLDVQLDTRLGPDDLGKLDRCRALFEDFCTVSASIREGIPVHVRVTQLETSDSVPPVPAATLR